MMEQSITRTDLEEDGWSKLTRIDSMMASFNGGAQDRNLPLIKGSYRLYYDQKHPKIRITEKSEECEKTLFLGWITDLATFKLVQELVGIKNYNNDTNNTGTRSTGPR